MKYTKEQAELIKQAHENYKTGPHVLFSKYINANTEPDLKPCPFCGGEPTIREREEDGDWDICCETKGCLTSPVLEYWYDNRAEAIEAWNKRVV